MEEFPSQALTEEGRMISKWRHRVLVVVGTAGCAFLALCSCSGLKAGIHAAAAAGNVRGVRALLRKGVDVNALNEHDMTPLHLAAEEHRAKVARLLLDQGADVDAVDEYEYTPLHYAVQEGDPRTVQLLLANGADPNREYPHDSTARAGEHRVVRLDTMLHTALDGRSIDVAKALVLGGANTSVRDVFGRQPLHKAASLGEVELAKLLLERGADPNARDYGVFVDVLWPVSWRRAPRYSIGWLEYRDENVSKACDMTPLHHAAAAGQTATLKLLSEAGADLQKQDERGWTALHWAAECGQRRVAEFLLFKGIDANTKNTLGETPLSLAVGKGHKDVVEVLLAHGAGVKATDIFGRTPLHYAAERGHTNVVGLLLRAGAEVNVEDSNGRTPLKAALEEEKADVAESLRNHGAIE